MKRSPIPTLAFAALPLSAGFAMAQVSSMANFCNGGLLPDGYIDFADMPAAPAFPSSGTSAPFTAVLPVHGVSGLTVQVTVPALQQAVHNPSTPLYQQTPGAIRFNGSSDTGLQLSFSTPIKGVGVSNSLNDRGVFFSLSTDPIDAPISIFKSSVENQTQYQSIDNFALEAVKRTGTFQSTYVSLPAATGYENGTLLSNLRVQSVNAEANAEAQVAKAGLQMWLRSEDIVAYPGAAVWPDRSGAGHDATPQGASVGIQFFGSACRSAYPFGGAFYGPAGNKGDFNFNLPINGWQQMTVFLVAASAADPNDSASFNAGIFWNENAYWGNTFVSPFQTHTNFRFGTTQVGNQPSYTRSIEVGNDLTVTRAVHNQTTDSLYVDGQLVFSQGGKYASLNGTTGAGTLGLGYQGTPFQGEISEVLVYNRVLTEAESTAVEKYLRAKFRTQ